MEKATKAKDTKGAKPHYIHIGRRFHRIHKIDAGVENSISMAEDFQ